MALEKYRLPSRYSPVIGAINARLKRFADEQDRVSFVDCNEELVEIGMVSTFSTPPSG